MISAFKVINMIINLFVGISVGANVVVSNCIGSGNEEKARSAAHSSMLLAAICGILILFIGLAVSEPVLTLMDTPEDVLPYAVQYLRIYSIGMPFIMIYNFGASLLRCIGDTKRPLMCLIFSGVLNAGLNIFLVVVFHLDVAGVAIATVISNALSTAMVIVFLLREKSYVRIEMRRLAIRRQDLSRILRVGVPAGLQSMVFSFSNIFIQSELNGFGTAAVAGSAVALNYENFSYFVISAFSQAAVTFTSQNYGARRYGRCRSVFRICMSMAAVSTFIMSWVFILGRGFFSSIFTSDPDVLAYSVERLSIVLPLYILIVTYDTGGAALRGLGYSMTPALFTIFGTCVFRLFWVYVICRIYPRFSMLMAVYPISWAMTGAAVLTAYFILRRKAFARPSAS